MLKIKHLVIAASIVGAFFGLNSCTEKQELIEPEEITDNITINVNGVSFVMVKVEEGMFRMGSDGYLFDIIENEAPSHNVSMSTFYISETEVTQELWEAVMGDNPSTQNDDEDSKCPVETVSWNDCQTFIENLNSLTGRVFALPTEAQWEYAARGGNNQSEFTYSGSDNLQKVGWFSDNTPVPRDVKGKAPNELGVYDMSGNVAEWCNDWYGLYSGSFQEDPLGHHSGTERVVRGGSWNSLKADCRNTARFAYPPDYSSSAIGFRLVMK